MIIIITQVNGSYVTCYYSYETT